MLCTFEWEWHSVIRNKRIFLCQYLRQTPCRETWFRLMHTERRTFVSIVDFTTTAIGRYNTASASQRTHCRLLQNTGLYATVGCSIKPHTIDLLAFSPLRFLAWLVWSIEACCSTESERGHLDLIKIRSYYVNLAQRRRRQVAARVV